MGKWSALEIMKTSICSFALSLGFALLGLPAGGAEQFSLTFSSIGSSEQIPATLIRPDGEGLFPAVVLMHDCSGLGAHSSGAPMRWATELLSQGYVALIPDSFTPRGIADGVCTLPSNQARIANGYVRVGDAYGDLTMPFYGYNRPGAKVSEGVRESFWLQGMMAGFPACYFCIKAFSETDLTEDLKKMDVPTLFLHGDDDQIVPIADSAMLAVKFVKKGTLKVYKGAPHGMCTTHKNEVNEDLLAFIKE